MNILISCLPHHICTCHNLSLSSPKKTKFLLIVIVKNSFWLCYQFVLEATCSSRKKHRKAIAYIRVPVHCKDRIKSTGLDQQHTTLREEKKNTHLNTKNLHIPLLYTYTHTHPYIYTHSQTHTVAQLFWSTTTHQHQKPTDTKVTLPTVQKSKNISKYTIIIYSSSIDSNYGYSLWFSQNVHQYVQIKLS